MRFNAVSNSKALFPIDSTVAGIATLSTAENLDNVSSGKEVVVYAATFTKAAGSDTWKELVPLTRGTADANNYSGYGSANSFNTDTWLSDEGKSMRQLVAGN